MASCELIFVLNDGTELIGKTAIDENLSLFPLNILETVKPFYLELSSKEITHTNKSVIRVYQNGEIDIKENVPPLLPFYPDLH